MNICGISTGIKAHDQKVPCLLRVPEKTEFREKQSSGENRVKVIDVVIATRT